MAYGYRKAARPASRRKAPAARYSRNSRGYSKPARNTGRARRATGTRRTSAVQTVRIEMVMPSGNLARPDVASAKPEARTKARF